MIYQQRRRYDEAVARFRKAVEIDAGEVDAHYQLGRIARAQGRLGDALESLERVIALDEKHSLSEVWREVGAVYLEMDRAEEARAALGKYVERREYDPEGLYWYGKALARLGREKEAGEAFDRAMEAVETMAPHRRGQVRQWGGRARAELKRLRG